MLLSFTANHILVYFIFSLQLSPEVESALLQQVLSLTPEQLSSLPQEQQQQVLRLQQMLSAGKIV